jgi:hypothetical protein
MFGASIVLRELYYVQMYDILVCENFTHFLSTSRWPFTLKQVKSFIPRTLS